MTDARWWAGRWVRACGVAALLAVWPACSNRVSPPDGTAASDVTWNVPLVARETANLNFVVKDASGADFKMADLTGKPLVLNFWATWCVPCKTEMPWFMEFAEQYKSKDLKVVGISVDDTADDVKKYTAQQPVTYPLLLGRDHAELLKAYHAGEFVPITWLIGRDGVVRIKIRGIHEKAWFQQQIETLF